MGPFCCEMGRKFHLQVFILLRFLYRSCPDLTSGPHTLPHVTGATSCSVSTTWAQLWATGTSSRGEVEYEWIYWVTVSFHSIYGSYILIAKVLHIYRFQKSHVSVGSWQVIWAVFGFRSPIRQNRGSRYLTYSVTTIIKRSVGSFKFGFKDLLYSTTWSNVDSPTFSLVTFLLCGIICNHYTWLQSTTPTSDLIRSLIVFLQTEWVQ